MGKPKKKKQDHWQVGNVIHVRKESNQCKRCHKSRISGCHVGAGWMCNACLRIRAKNINQLLRIPGFLVGLPKLGS